MTYIPRRQGLLPQPAGVGPAPKPTWAKFCQEVLSSNMSAALAFVMIAGFAVTVGAVAQLAGAEILASSDALPVQHHIAQSNTGQRVLGLFTSAYGSSSMVNNATMRIDYGPVDANNNAWRYGFGIKRYSSRAGSILVTDMNRVPIYQADVNAQDNVTNDYVFTPQIQYRFEYYSAAGQKGTLLLRKFFTTPAITDRVAHPIGVACTTDVKICPDGSYVSRHAPTCEFAPCSTPGYGYQTVNVGPVNQGDWREGWIEMASRSEERRVGK